MYFCTVEINTLFARQRFTHSIRVGVWSLLPRRIQKSKGGTFRKSLATRKNRVLRADISLPPKIVTSNTLQFEHCKNLTYKNPLCVCVSQDFRKTPVNTLEKVREPVWGENT